MNVQQYKAALHWIYDKLEATANNPEPTIRWLGEDPVVLQANWPIDLREVPVGELTNSLASMVKVLGYVLNKAPVLTRVSLNLFDTYLTHQDRLAKTTRICNAFPNTEGLLNAADAYISLLECIRAVHSGAELILYKHVSGLAWISKWDRLKQQLHTCQSTIPKVTLDAKDRETLVKEGKELVALQGDCWRLFKTWVTERLRDIPNGLRDIQIIYPALREREINWEACLNSLKTNQYDRCFVFAAPENISPAQFRGLKTTFDDVDRVLLQIANSRESTTNVIEDGLPLSKRMSRPCWLRLVPRDGQWALVHQ